MDEEKQNTPEYFKGRGAQINTQNRFLKQHYVQEHLEMLDEPLMTNEKTQVYYETPKKIINAIDSPDIPMPYSMNPYQGCEHGCIYCYARNTHEYWGFSAGMDFEQKIIAKTNAAELIRKQLMNKNWQPAPIMLSGNTDCYQPLERKLKITRSMLEVVLEFRHPVGIITKNSLILRDIDLIEQLAERNLVHVMISITSLKDELRQLLEPRTATAKNRLKVIEELSKRGIPVGVMTAPIIPGLNSDEIPAIIEAAAQKGARIAGYTIVRLNGAVKDVFHDWLYKNLPDSASKIWNHITEIHGGQVNDSRFGTRMKGQGNMAQSIHQLFTLSVKRFIKEKSKFEYDLSAFRRPATGGQMDLFDI